MLKMQGEYLVMQILNTWEIKIKCFKTNKKNTTGCSKCERERAFNLLKKLHKKKKKTDLF